MGMETSTPANSVSPIGASMLNGLPDPVFLGELRWLLRLQLFM